ncbi:MAG: hypothetical protein MUC97_08030 [Bernardetiaceae bacterium]|jgi:hypothetical protein|nr:hypothetical protein [Bernardetiaceae bacterium]
MKQEPNLDEIFRQQLQNLVATPSEAANRRFRAMLDGAQLAESQLVSPPRRLVPVYRWAAAGLLLLASGGLWWGLSEQSAPAPLARTQPAPVVVPAPLRAQPAPVPQSAVQDQPKPVELPAEPFKAILTLEKPAAEPVPVATAELPSALLQVSEPETASPAPAELLAHHQPVPEPAVATETGPVQVIIHLSDLAPETEQPPAEKPKRKRGLAKMLARNEANNAKEPEVEVEILGISKNLIFKRRTDR